MRSPADFVRALALCVALALPAAHASTPQEVRQAAAEVAKDPDLGGTRKESVLRFRPRDPEKVENEDGRTLAWLRQLVRWFSEAGRWLVFLLGAIAVAILAIRLHRWMQVRGDALLPRPGAAPTHVQGLDIRAASLPDVIGAAAAQLWDQGRHREALSLLYRGALSRLVHRHAVPVRGSSTEAECVQLARGHVDEERGAFFARLVQVWQYAVYGARLPEREVVAQLCEGFDRLWPEAPRTAA